MAGKTRVSIKEQKNKSMVFIYYSKDRKPLWISTGIHKKDKTIKENKAKIVSMFHDVSAIVSTYCNENKGLYPPVDYVRAQMGREKRDETDLLSLYDTFLQNRVSENPDMFRGEDMSHSTKKNWNIIRDYIELILKDNPTIVSKTIDIEFVKKFQKLLFDKNWKDNSSRVYLINLRSFLNWLYENKYMDRYIVEETWNKEIFSQLRIYKKGNKECLRKEELDFLIEKRKTYVGNKPRSKKALDMFIFSCLSAMSFVELSRMKRSFVNFSTNEIVIPRKKTGEECNIQITPIMKSILEDYDYDFQWKHGSLGLYNEYLKDMFIELSYECPSFAEDTLDIKYIKRKEIRSTRKRYTFFSSHTGRHSYITLSRQAGIDDNSILKTTGQVRTETMLGYNNAKAQRKDEKSLEDYVLKDENEINYMDLISRCKDIPGGKLQLEKIGELFKKN